IFQPTGYFSLDLAAGTGTYMRLREGWRPGIGNSIEEIVETVQLQAPDADQLGLELAAFVAAVRGERAAIVTAEEGRTALALALDVSRAVHRTPVPQIGRWPPEFWSRRGNLRVTSTARASSKPCALGFQMPRSMPSVGPNWSVSA